MDVTAFSLRSVAAHERNHKGHVELAGIIDCAADRIEAMSAALHAPLSSEELKLVDKNCDWIAFKHAWNAVMKSRLAQITG
jgi:hypothetical protein